MLANVRNCDHSSFYDKLGMIMKKGIHLTLNLTISYVNFSITSAVCQFGVVCLPKVSKEASLIAQVMNGILALSFDT